MPELPQVSTAHRQLAIIVAAGLVVRAYLIHRYPPVYGGDTILRLANAEHIVPSYQLRLLQAAIHYLRALSGNLLLVNPFLLAHSVVPYQEILMVAGLVFAFHFAFAGRWLPVSLASQPQHVFQQDSVSVRVYAP